MKRLRNLSRRRKQAKPTYRSIVAQCSEWYQKEHPGEVPGIDDKPQLFVLYFSSEQDAGRAAYDLGKPGRFNTEGTGVWTVMANACRIRDTAAESTVRKATKIITIEQWEREQGV